MDEAAGHLANTWDHRSARRDQLLSSAARVDPLTAQQATQQALDRPFLAAQVVDTLIGSYPPKQPPLDWSVAAVDGSHIDVDRHILVNCYLINIGGCVLTYGAKPSAELFSDPSLSTNSGDLFITDPDHATREEPVTGVLLGLRRAVTELEQLVEAVDRCPPGVPVLALIDGSLILWGLAGQAYRPFVRNAIIQDHLLKALDQLRERSRSRPVSLAAYVSFPRSTEVVNAVKCCRCPNSPGQCRQTCNNRRSTNAPCDLANDLMDRDLFQSLLEPGYRSPVYRTNSSVPREHYGEHQVCFYYIHSGAEIGRVEIPEWVAHDETLLALSHSLIADQCRKGQGYPVAISEAHEQAVVNTTDRRLFRELVSDALERRGLPAYTSQKDASKRMPWL